MVVRAQPVVDEVEGLVVKYRVIQEHVVRRHASVVSREHGDVRRGDDHDPSGECDAVDDGRGAARLVCAHRVLPKHDVVADGDQDAQAGQRKGQSRHIRRAKVVVVRGNIVGGLPIVHADARARVQEYQPRAVVVQDVARDAACGRIPHEGIPQRSEKAVLFWIVKSAFGELPR